MEKYECVNMNQAVKMDQHTPRTVFSFCLSSHGHQPRTDFWEKSEFLDVAHGPIFPSSIFRLHFSGVLAGGTRLSRSSSTEPVGNVTLHIKTSYIYCGSKVFMFSGQTEVRDGFTSPK